jgi:flavin reductase (NADH)
MKESFIEAMRHLVYPVSIVSSRLKGAKLAITVSSVTSVSANPPSLLVCINKESTMAKTIETGSFLNVSFLNPAQTAIASICSSKDKVHERFEYDQWLEDANKTPYLEESEAVVFCQVVNLLEHATHKIIILAVKDVSANSGQNPNPLLYCNREYTQLK